MRRRTSVVLGVAIGALAGSSPAAATWSVVAVDPQTGQVGVAGASCHPQVSVIAGLVPGKGAVASQAYLNMAARDLAVMRIEEGATPTEIIAEIANANFDNGYQTRQHGVCVLGETPAGFTGDQADDWKGDLQGQSFNVSIQGNILEGPAVVGDALTAFEAEYEECPFTLADRLMIALEAGSAAGGDARCNPPMNAYEQTAWSAFIYVAEPGDPANAFTLQLFEAVDKPSMDNPVDALRVAYDAWRLEHPPDDSLCGDGDGETGETGGTGETGDGGTGDPGAEDEPDKGCTCTADPRPRDLTLALLGLALARRRRR